MNPEGLNKLREDIKKSGFPSELKLKRALWDHGWHPEGFEHYFDRDEGGKLRAIDVWTFKNCTIPHPDYASFQYVLVCEVKKSERPWVVFDRGVLLLPECAPQTNLVTNYPFKLSEIGDVFSASGLVNRNGWLGSGIYEAFGGGKNEAWHIAASSVAKACIYHSQESDVAKGLRDETEDSFFEIFKPVVVVDGPLVKAELRDDGEVDLEEISMAAMHFEYETVAYTPRSVHQIDLVALSGIEEYLDFADWRCDEIAKGINDFVRGKK